MLWYKSNLNKHDVVISSRVRFIRNLENYPFPSRLDAKGASEIIARVGSLLENNGYQAINFADISQNTAVSYCEKRYVNRDFTKISTPHALYLNESEGTSVALCGDDHIKIQTITPGLALEEAYLASNRVEDLIDASFDIAFSERFGYLTEYPTDLGLAMKASLIMFLPGYSINRQIENLYLQLIRVGCALRPLYPATSEPHGYLYVVSTNDTSGISEEDLITKISDIAEQIINRELSFRASFTGVQLDRLTDRAERAFGILSSSYMISVDETIRLCGDMRLGAVLGIFNIDRSVINSILIESMPSTLSLMTQSQPKTDMDKEKLRATFIRDMLSSESINQVQSMSVGVQQAFSGEA